MESIQLTGNKPTFNNYLTDPMILPINAKVCLNKASFAIPVWTQQFVEIPLIDAADHNNIMFVVELNGISKQISWEDFYNAWDSLNELDTRTIDEFYNGTYKFYFNNLVYWISVANTLNTLPTFTEVLAKTMNDIFLFFDIQPSDIIINGVRTEINKNDTIDIDGTDYLPYTSNLQIKALQLISEYNPTKNWGSILPMSTANNTLWTAINDVTITNNEEFGSLVNFTHSGTPKVYGGIAICETPMDPNCGVWRFRPVMTGDGHMIASFLFDSQYLDINTTLTTFDQSSVEIGIKFNRDGNILSYSFLDTVITEVGGITNVQYPTKDDDQKILKFTNNVDIFFITCHRAANYDTKAGKYVFKFYKSDGANNDINDAALMYSSTYSLSSPGVSMFPIALSDNEDSQLQRNAFIELTEDSESMATPTALASNKVFSIRPIPDTVDVESLFYQHEFFDSIGLYQNEDDSNLKVSYDSAPMSNKIKWTTGKIKKKYFIGVNNINKIFDYSGGFINLKTGSSALPRQMEVSLLNTSHTPHTGSFAQEVLFTEPDINKVISYINTNADDFNTDNNLYLEYVYEAYNIVCRRLKNRSKLPLNNFQIKIGYKDFITNEEKIIDALQGICKLEILFEGEDDQHH